MPFCSISGVVKDSSLRCTDSARETVRLCGSPGTRTITDAQVTPPPNHESDIDFTRWKEVDLRLSYCLLGLMNSCVKIYGVLKAHKPISHSMSGVLWAPRSRWTRGSCLAAPVLVIKLGRSSIQPLRMVRIEEVKVSNLMESCRATGKSLSHA